ncbi:MAG: HAD-IA family hydrolase [Bacteroidetes bacterium]|nr:HAD-IA family hydrolase [Bacteroidota bacterium]
MGNLKGILFDMDGVLVDSEHFIAEAAIRMFAEQCVYVEAEDFIPFIGTGEDRYLGGVAQKYDYAINLERDKLRTYEIYGEIVKHKLKPLPGIKAFIGKCKKAAFKLAVATSADKIKMDINLRELKLESGYFDTTVNGLEVINKKPDPEIFIKAAAKLGLSTMDCLVVEDAVNGVKAAKQAGCRCLAITSSFDKKSLSEADWIVDSFLAIPREVLAW